MIGEGQIVLFRFRIARLAVVEGAFLRGAIGQVATERLVRIKSKLGQWINGQ